MSDFKMTINGRELPLDDSEKATGSLLSKIGCCCCLCTACLSWIPLCCFCCRMSSKYPADGGADQNSQVKAQANDDKRLLE